jgi:endonuclease/exonuclease/phosphatase family metal-dependent hydrolase
MLSRLARRVSTCALALLIAPSSAVSAFAGNATVKVAFWNVMSGKGVAALPGHLAPFTNTPNCTDPTQPLNAWGVGAMQAELTKALSDPSVVALGVAESWSSVCGSPANIRQALGWKANTNEQNGVGLVARYGLAGPEQWQQLDTSLNTVPADTAWVLRVPVCVNSACTDSMPVYVAHWYASGSSSSTTYATQASQTATFLKNTSGGQPHVLVGDLNTWEGTTSVCSQAPNNTTLTYLRNAGYVDAWISVHGALEGFTGMANRAGCGIPEGYTWKRIDYAWTQPTYPAVDIQRFGMVTPGDASPSDHYGIVVTLPYPGTTPPPTTDPTQPPTTQPPTTQPPTTQPPAAGTGDIVLWAKNAINITGAWSLVNDATAAGGVRIANPDAGVAKLATAAVAPASYFDLSFSPETGKQYRLWIRGKALNDSWQNDSTFVQFSGSLAADGTPAFRIGTTSATVVSIEESSGAGVAGWGWQENGYGVNVYGPTVSFDSTRQTLRVQVREDGLSIDQIVLSPVTYLTAAPGAAKNDATILPATTAPVTTTDPTSGFAWTSAVKATASGATITKTSGCGECSDAGAVGNQSMTSGSVSFTVSGGRLLAGLGTDTSASTNYATVDYAFNFSSATTWDIREKGVYKTEGNYSISDVFKIAIEGATAKYYRNDTLVYTSKTAVPGALVMDTTLVTMGAAVQVVASSGSTTATTTSPVTTAPMTTSTPTATSSTPLRVLQWNTHHGGYGTDGVYNTDRLASWIVKMNPDVVLLNEIEKLTSWGNQDQPEVYKNLLQAKTGKTWYYTFAQEFGQWTSNGKGNMILSTVPFDTVDHYELVNNLDRNVAEASISWNGKRVTFVLTHLDPDSATLRLTQAQEVTTWASASPEARILTGDMNAWPDQTSIAHFNTLYNDSWSVALAAGTAVSFPGNDGQTKNGRIDYIYYSKGSTNLDVVSSQVFDTRDVNGYMPSDHRPLLTTFVVR